MRILHTMLRVGDLPRAIDFYTGCSACRSLRTTDRPEQKYKLAFVGYGDEARGAVLELTYNYDVAAYDIGAGFGHVAIEVDGRRRSMRRGARGGRHGHARSGSGEGRHDGDRVRPGPGRLQDRADRATKERWTRATAPAGHEWPRATLRPQARLPLRTSRSAAASRRSCAKTRRPGHGQTYRRRRPSGSNTNVPAE